MSRAVRDPAWGAWGRGGDGVALGGNTAAGVTVNSQSATALSTIYACLTARGEALLQMPVDQITTQGGTRREAASRSAWLDRPNVDMLWPQFIDQCVWSLDTDGNIFLAPTRDGLGRVVELWPLDPACVVVRRDTPGRPKTYEVDGVPFRGEMVHIALHVPPGAVRGLNPIIHCAESIGGAIAAQVFGSTWFGNSAMPSVVLEAPGNPTIDQQREMRGSWFRHHGGARRANLPGLLVGGVTAKVLNVSPEQSQFLETRRFNVADVCGIWHVPPEYIGFGADTSGIAYQNLGNLKLRMLQQSLMATMTVIEAALSELLPRPQRLKFNPDVWLRADVTTRYAAHQVAVQTFATPNERRILEDLPPIEGGDEPLWLAKQQSLPFEAESPAEEPIDD
jgi:HK97 family phage portal protein